MIFDAGEDVHKLLLFMKRKPGMSLAAFRDYYENRHIPLCMNHMRGAERYFRRYLEPVAGIEEPEFDVITELWFKSRKAVDMIIATMQKDAMPAEVIADELNLFDRSKTRFHAVSEAETDLENY
jgi:EthD domain